MNGRASISVGNYRIGYLFVDPTSIEGQGDALGPALVVPAALQLDACEEGKMIAITEIEADLLFPAGSDSGGAVQVGGPARASTTSIRAGLWTSVVSGPAEHQVAFRFVLGREHVRLLEDQARHLGTEPVPLELSLRVQAAWVRKSENAPRPGPAGHPVPAATGLASELWPLWEAGIEALRLHLRREDWGERVLPGLGGNRLRLIAVRMPAASRLLGFDAAVAFDAACVAYDAGEYRRAVQACRDLREAVAGHLGTADGERLADRVGELLGWAEDFPSRDLLDGLWKTLIDISGAASHRRGRQLTAIDARASILIAATTVEYLTELLGPAGLN
jgi:hypothetical protein